MATSAALIDEVHVERVGSALGARVKGVDLGGPWSPGTIDGVRRALHQYGVLFFQYDHALSGEEFAAFGELIGEVEDGYRISSLEERPKGDGVMDSDRVPMASYNTNEWHSDGTLFERPPQSAMLTPVQVPSLGGDTMWAGMYAAYDALSPPLQQLLEGVEVLHSSARLSWLKSEATAVHPAVIRDPVTQKKMLFVNANYSERILGMSEWESEGLLQMLFKHVNAPEFHVRLSWQPGMIAVWEERVTQHRGVADFTGSRRMRRLTFIGDRPAR